MLAHPVMIVAQDSLLDQASHPVLQVVGGILDAGSLEVELRPCPEALDGVEGGGVDAIVEQLDVESSRLVFHSIRTMDIEVVDEHEDFATPGDSRHAIQEQEELLYVNRAVHDPVRYHRALGVDGSRYRDGFETELLLCDHDGLSLWCEPDFGVDLLAREDCFVLEQNRLVRADCPHNPLKTVAPAPLLLLQLPGLQADVQAQHALLDAVLFVQFSQVIKRQLGPRIVNIERCHALFKAQIGVIKELSSVNQLFNLAIREPPSLLGELQVRGQRLALLVRAQHPPHHPQRHVQKFGGFF